MLYTTSAIQILALAGKLPECDHAKVAACEFFLPNHFYSLCAVFFVFLFSKIFSLKLDRTK
jgi:hypothetical protein